MNITINGDIYITQYGESINDIVGNGSVDLDLNYMDDDFDEMDIPFADCDCDLTYDDFEEKMDDILEYYSDILSSECVCPDCIKENLLKFLNDFMKIGI